MTTTTKTTRFFLFVFFSLLLTQAGAQQNKVIALETSQTSLIYTVGENGRLDFRYYGNRLNSNESFAAIKSYGKADTKRDLSYEAYPSYGLGCINEPALQVIHSDGSLITELAFQKQETISEKPHVIHSVIYLKDKEYNLIVELHTQAYADEDVLVQWVVIKNQEKGAVTLKNYFSSYLNVKAQNYYLTHTHGSWAGEMDRVEEKLTSGIKAVESKKGVRTTQTENASFILSVNHPATENEGTCYGGALAWSGNYKLSFEVDEWGQLNILSGVNPFLASYHLKPGEQLTTPKMIYTFSSNGQGQVSRNFHDWSRKYALVDGFKPRPIVLNSWEGAYFSFDEATLTNMMDEAAKLGVEMFVLDDGWFGNKYPRNSDNAGLGDWQTNTKKLPRGLDYLIDHANSVGLDFGIWIEPEMVNPASELAEKHPEWIVQSPGREKITWRHQLLLDLSNPAVQDFIWNMVDSLLTTHPKIAYIKWDANRHVEQVGSTYLPADEQTHFWVDYTNGLYSIYDKIRAKYPRLIMQACASGGGRLDFGSLKYHQEFWASDNTDPLKRIFIQYSTNLIYPPIATASHVSTSPNHQTGRSTPLKFRFDVAMTGRLGMELQPKDIQGEEREFALEAIANYKKQVRPLVAGGDLYRLLSPYDEGNWASQMYVSKDKKSAVLFAFSTDNHNRGIYPTLKMQGLDPDKKYRVKEINQGRWPCFWGNEQVFSGEFLSQAGIEITISRQFDSAVFLITED